VSFRAPPRPARAASLCGPVGCEHLSACGSRLGQVELVFVPDGEMRISPTAVMHGSTDQDWAARKHLLDGDGRLRLSVGGLLIRTGRQVVLVDVGLGPLDAELPDGSGHLFGGGLLDSLRELDVEPAAVDVVVLTHLHPDHVG
jgi:glyoxylase-like metal-dependent hydrolase (beta-lactamase superfamily II)